MVAGIPYKVFWGDEITPKWFNACVSAYNKRLEDWLVSADIANYQLGLYIKLAVGEVLSDKGKRYYPKEPQLVHAIEEAKKNKDIRWLTPEETEAFLAKRRAERKADDKESSDTDRR